MTPAQATKSRMAQVKSVADNNDCFERTARAVRTENNFFRTDSPSQGGLATAFDRATFRLSMIAPVKKSVNHARTVACLRERGWEQEHQQEVHLRSNSTV